MLLFGADSAMGESMLFVDEFDGYYGSCGVVRSSLADAIDIIMLIGAIHDMF